MKPLEPTPASGPVPGLPAPDPEVARLLAEDGGPEVPRARRIWVNRNLKMSRVEAVGFDMDYTLAIYHMRRIEQLSFDMTVARLVDHAGYPAEARDVRYDHRFVMRGLVVDKAHGNLFKLDRFNHVGRAYHGRRLLDRESWKRLYRDERIELSSPRFAWVDTLFALPEASIYAEVIERLEPLGHRLDYARLYDDVREAIDTVHRDGSLKAVIARALPDYVRRDPELGPALHRLRSSGKRLFLLTNSLFDYTDGVMRHLLDGVLPEYPSWRGYFDHVIVGGAKPRFFTERHPFLELDDTGAVLRAAASLERGRVYQGGNLVDFERLTGLGGDRVLYVGDHIYGDIVQSKKTSLWRTCMIVEELEDEIAHVERHREALRRLVEWERLRGRLEDALGAQKAALHHLERRLRDDPGAREERREAARRLEALRRAARRADEESRAIEGWIEDEANPYWGLIFKEGHENSRFGEQVEDYACLYTGRVSNFLHYSPMGYFRSPRDRMPHELDDTPLSPFGRDGREPADRPPPR